MGLVGWSSSREVAVVPALPCEFRRCIRAMTPTALHSRSGTRPRYWRRSCSLHVPTPAASSHRSHGHAAMVTTRCTRIGRRLSRLASRATSSPSSRAFATASRTPRLNRAASSSTRTPRFARASSHRSMLAREPSTRRRPRGPRRSTRPDRSRGLARGPAGRSPNAPWASRCSRPGAGRCTARRIRPRRVSRASSPAGRGGYS